MYVIKFYIFCMACFSVKWTLLEIFLKINISLKAKWLAYWFRGLVCSQFLLGEFQ